VYLGTVSTRLQSQKYVGPRKDNAFSNYVNHLKGPFLKFAAKLLGGPPCYLIGSLVELLIPIGP
jgi:hypothetical protein